MALTIATPMAFLSFMQGFSIATLWLGFQLYVAALVLLFMEWLRKWLARSVPQRVRSRAGRAGTAVRTFLTHQTPYLRLLLLGGVGVLLGSMLSADHDSATHEVGRIVVGTGVLIIAAVLTHTFARASARAAGLDLSAAVRGRSFRLASEAIGSATVAAAVGSLAYDIIPPGVRDIWDKGPATDPTPRGIFAWTFGAFVMWLAIERWRSDERTAGRR
jgi:hypothetical protein